MQKLHTATQVFVESTEIYYHIALRFLLSGMFALHFRFTVYNFANMALSFLSIKQVKYAL